MSAKILVIGDSCLDQFIYCSARRLCPDVPVPVLNIVEKISNPGMAMNLVENIKSLGYECDCITQKNWKSVTKTRYIDYASNHTFIRVDANENSINRLNFNLLKAIRKYDLVAISDYDKGFLSDWDIMNICNIHDNVFVDTKKKISNYLSKAKFIKINTPEYDNSKDFIESNDWPINKIIKTCGENGAVFNGKHFPAKKVEVRDVSGAGDSFFAGLICKYLETGKIENAIKFANKCAAKVVAQKGVTTINN